MVILRDYYWFVYTVSKLVTLYFTCSWWISGLFCYQTRVGLLLGELDTETTPGRFASQSHSYLFQ